MSLEAFVDIRFGDPVISLSLNSDGLVFGSMMGRLLYYHFNTKSERVISEISDEFISGLWLSPDNTMFACIGDLKALMISNPGGERYHKQYITFDKIHTSMSCELSQIKMHKDSIFIGVLEPQTTSDSLTHTVSPIYLINLTDMQQASIEGIRFPPHTVLFDYDKKNLLYMEYQSNCRILFLYRVNKRTREVKVIHEKFGFAKIWNKRILYVHRQKVIRIMNKSGRDKGEIGRHKSYIVAIGVVKIEKNEYFFRSKVGIGEVTEDKGESENRPEGSVLKDYVVSVDIDGGIRIWSESKLVEEIFIRNLTELSQKYRKAQYFSMGYPYLVDAYGPRIAITTDLGVLVIKSKEFEHYSQMSS